MTARSWSLVFEGERPWTVNGERKMVPRQRAAKVAEWRARAAVMAKAEGIPALDVVRVRARPLVRNRRAMQDVGGCLPAVKAVVDGLVDARVLTDDGPAIVTELVFSGPALGGVDGLLVVIEELG